MRLVHRLFSDDDHLARIRRGAVVARARNPVAAGAAQLVVIRLIGMVLAHPSDAAADWAVRVHDGAPPLFGDRYLMVFSSFSVSSVRARRAVLGARSR